MKIEELARIVRTLAELHPEIEVQFVYPTKRGGKPWSKMTSTMDYTVYPGSGIMRIWIDTLPHSEVD